MENRRAEIRFQCVQAIPIASLPDWSLGRFKTRDRLTIYTALWDELYDQEGSSYGAFGGADFADNDNRFARLCLAAAEIATGEADPNSKPDIIHVNDWPSALVPGYLSWKGPAHALHPNDP